MTFIDPLPLIAKRYPASAGVVQAAGHPFYVVSFEGKSLVSRSAGGRSLEIGAMVQMVETPSGFQWCIDGGGGYPSQVRRLLESWAKAAPHALFLRYCLKNNPRIWLFREGVFDSAIDKAAGYVWVNGGRMPMPVVFSGDSGVVATALNVGEAVLVFEPTRGEFYCLGRSKAGPDDGDGEDEDDTNDLDDHDNSPDEDQTDLTDTRELDPAYLEWLWRQKKNLLDPNDLIPPDPYPPLSPEYPWPPSMDPNDPAYDPNAPRWPDDEWDPNREHDSDRYAPSSDEETPIGWSRDPVGNWIYTDYEIDRNSLTLKWRLQGWVEWRYSYAEYTWTHHYNAETGEEWWTVSPPISRGPIASGSTSIDISESKPDQHIGMRDVIAEKNLGDIPPGYPPVLHVGATANAWGLTLLIHQYVGTATYRVRRIYSPDRIFIREERTEVSRTGDCWQGFAAFGNEGEEYSSSLGEHIGQPFGAVLETTPDPETGKDVVTGVTAQVGFMDDTRTISLTRVPL